MKNAIFKLNSLVKIGVGSINFLPDQLVNGIRSKEFYGIGLMSSDATPVDTDFSEPFVTWLC